MDPIQSETRTVTGSQVVAVRRNADGAKVLIIETTYADASTEQHTVPVMWSEVS